MARGKKKETLTPEERLQAALVPESEQPYPVPGNWCWIHLLDSFYNYTDSKKKIPQKEYIKDGDIAVVDQGQDLVGGYTNDRELAFSGNLPVIIFGDHTRCIKYIDFPFAQGADGVKVLKPKPFFDAKAFYYAFQNVNIPNMGYRRHFPLFDQYTIPLPPLAEQQRIIDRIESLFAKLDEAKQKAQDALDSFETRKAAILHEAFTGELTAQWRKEHGVGMESWKEETLESVCYSIFDGDHMPPPKSEKGIPFLVISNVNTGHLSFENTRFVPESYYEALSDTRKPGYGDVLYTLVGSYGIPVIVDSEHPFCFQRHMALLKPKNIDSYYLWYILQSREMFEKATQIATGTAQLTVPIKGLRQLKFNCASANEQTEIVRILDDLLAKEQQAKEAAEEVLEQIDLIKKAILARAFRGELGTNDPGEESAIKLLERSFSETIEIERVKPKQVAKKKAEVIFVPKTIMEALSTGMRLTPEKLKRETELPIDDFYARLKELIDNGSVVESRENGESYLEAANENRQAKNQ